MRIAQPFTHQCIIRAGALLTSITAITLGLVGCVDPSVEEVPEENAPEENAPTIRAADLSDPGIEVATARGGIPSSLLGTPCAAVGILSGPVTVHPVSTGEILVASANTLFKFSGAGGTGHNMFAMGLTGSTFCGLQGYGYYLGHQTFQGLVQTVDYINQQTIVGLSDGKILKVQGTGGIGPNMFAVQEVTTSCGFTAVPGSNHYVGSYKFEAAVVDVTPVNDQTFISINNGRLLKVNGTGGSGCNMFAIQTAGSSCGFVGVPGYNYYAGSQVFSSAVVSRVTPVGAQTLLSFADGRMLKINGAGGSGCNMFAIEEAGPSCGFVGFPGYNYYAGSQVFSSAISDVTLVGTQTLISFANGRMLKINGSGGSGCNMFAIQEVGGSCGFAGFSGYNYYAGSQVFGAGISDVAHVAAQNQTLIGLTSGQMLKINGAGGGGCNMFAIQNVGGSCGFTGFPGYYYYAGSQVFNSGVASIRSAGSYTFTSVTGGKLLKVNGTGGGGCNMFAVQESASDFSSLPGYNYYVGDQS